MNLHNRQNYLDICTKIETAARKAGRQAQDVTLIAVTKTFEASDILPVLESGHLDFGENRVQESAGKWPALRRQFTKLNLHLIGPLQTNKAAEAIGLFDAIHTIDRSRIARAVAVEMKRLEKQLQLFVQVNTGAEPQKAGIAVAEADAFIEECRVKHGLQVHGLMCIPPAAENPEKHFDLLAKMAIRNDLKYLSMGMSGDFETAIAYGATHVRVGSAIFGTR
jgi:PLP dependent protein